MRWWTSLSHSRVTLSLGEPLHALRPHSAHLTSSLLPLHSPAIEVCPYATLLTLDTAPFVACAAPSPLSKLQRLRTARRVTSALPHRWRHFYISVSSRSAHCSFSESGLSRSCPSAAAASAASASKTTISSRTLALERSGRATLPEVSALSSLSPVG